MVSEKFPRATQLLTGLPTGAGKAIAALVESSQLNEKEGENKPPPRTAACLEGTHSLQSLPFSSGFGNPRPVLSCPVPSRPVPSRPVMSCAVPSCPVLSDGLPPCKACCDGVPSVGRYIAACRPAGFTDSENTGESSPEAHRPALLPPTGPFWIIDGAEGEFGGPPPSCLRRTTP